MNFARAVNVRSVKKYHDRKVDGNMINITRRAFHLWYLLGNPDHSVEGDLLRFIDDSDGVHYGRQGRRFILELLPTQSFYHAHRKEREFNRARVKKGTLTDPTPAHELNRLYKISEHTLVGPIGPEDIEPFRPDGSIPYTCSEANDRQNHIFRDWMQMWDQYQYEMKHHVGDNITQQYIERPLIIGCVAQNMTRRYQVRPFPLRMIPFPRAMNLWIVERRLVHHLILITFVWVL